MKLSWLIIGLLLAGCATQSVHNIDASGGKAAQDMNVQVESSIFIGASSAGLYLDNQFIGILPRGSKTIVKLPCGMHEIGVKPPGGGSHSFKMHSIKFDPCDGALPSLKVSFESFRGFFITRES